MAGVGFLDMSAAFDVVDHGLLLQKLKMYGFQEDVLCWTRSYLSDRYQCVSIEGSLSRLLAVRFGVPQGSILGPIFYTLFTNELPEVIHDQQATDPPVSQCPVYHLKDKNNGSICCYADDTTFTAIDSDHTALTSKLSAKYKTISEFMINNRLKLNDEKSHLLVISTSQARVRAHSCNLVEIRTPTEIIRPTCHEKLLGCWVQDNLKWSDHLRDHKESLIKALSRRCSAVKKLAKITSFKDRKMLAEGIFTSKLTYLIALWGGCEAGMMKALQISQNKVARLVARVDWDTPVREIFNQVGWLSVQQLAFYHSVLLVYNVKATKQPRYLSHMFNWSYKYNTRQADRGQIRLEGRPRLELTNSSFKWRAARQFNQLPMNILNCKSIKEFKVKVKIWIKDNVEF